MLKSGTCACLLAALALTPACRKQSTAGTSPSSAPTIPAELGSNRMPGSPQGLLSSRAASPVKWQHWEPEVLQRANTARRLVFAFVGSAQYPGCVEALDAIDRDSSLVALLNKNFVPVLVDTELSREGAIAAGMLSQEIRQPVSFPFILVLSPEGSEVTWRPVTFSAGGDLHQLFESAADVISRMWTDSPEYVEQNSRADHAKRLEKLPLPDPIPASTAERDEILVRTTRKLVSLYDADTNSISGTGGLLPLGMLQCLASASLDPHTPPDIAKRCREAVLGFGSSILSSAMVDPLDGGVYSTRRGNSWDLPMVNRNCTTQARAARALVTLHSATGDPRSLETALGAVRFAEEQYSAQNGLFCAQRLPASTPASGWLWTQEQIEQALSPSEATLWKAMCGIKGMGNIALEADPTREFFRLNSLGFRSTLASAAAAQNLSADEAAKILDPGRKKLLKARQDRVPDRAPSDAGSAAASFRMVSAYAALFTATGDPAWRTKAMALAERSRQAFTKGALLVEQSPGEPASICDARAFTYALAIQAALDLAEVTLDENWRFWAGDLTSTVAELFTDESGHLLEVRPLSCPLKLPLEDRVMLFDDSTAGLMRMNLARLEALGQPPPPSLAPWIHSLPKFDEFPVVFTDSILAASFARSRVIVEMPEKASPEWKEAACRLPLDRIGRHFSKGAAVKAIRSDGSEIRIESPATLASSILPATP